MVASSEAPGQIRGRAASRSPCWDRVLVVNRKHPPVWLSRGMLESVSLADYGLCHVNDWTPLYLVRSLERLFTASAPRAPTTARTSGAPNGTGLPHSSAAPSSNVTATSASTAARRPTRSTTSSPSSTVATPSRATSSLPALHATGPRALNGTAHNSEPSLKQVTRTQGSLAPCCVRSMRVSDSLSNGTGRRRPRRSNSHHQWWNGPASGTLNAWKLSQETLRGVASGKLGRRPVVPDMIRLTPTEGGTVPTTEDRAVRVPAALRLPVVQ